MKKFKSIRIFSIRLGYGWWFGNYFYFLKKNAFAIMPMWLHANSCTYKNGKAIENGDTASWSKSRKHEEREDNYRL